MENKKEEHFFVNTTNGLGLISQVEDTKYGYSFILSVSNNDNVELCDGNCEECDEEDCEDYE